MTVPCLINDKTTYATQEVRGLARTMKHTEVYGLRNRGTRDTIKGTLATMEAGGEDGHGIHATPAGTPPPMDDVSVVGAGAGAGAGARVGGGALLLGVIVAGAVCVIIAGAAWCDCCGCCLCLARVGTGLIPSKEDDSIPTAGKGVCEEQNMEHRPRSLLICWLCPLFVLMATLHLLVLSQSAVVATADTPSRAMRIIPETNVRMWQSCFDAYIDARLGGGKGYRHRNRF